jgi:hypothetical protein
MLKTYILSVFTDWCCFLVLVVLGIVLIVLADLLAVLLVVVVDVGQWWYFIKSD